MVKFKRKEGPYLELDKIAKGELSDPEHRRLYTNFSRFMNDRRSLRSGKSLASILNPNGKLPEKIYHYTTSGASENILREKNFWMTSYLEFHKKNDPSENRGMREYIEQGGKELEHVCRHILRKEQNGRVLTDSFVLCFSDAFNSEYLWENYAGEEGFCFEFDRTVIEEHFQIFKTSEKLALSFNILYADFCSNKKLSETKNAIILHDIDRAIEKANYYLKRGLDIKKDSKYAGRIFSRLLFDLHVFGLQLKKEKFIEEKEYRFNILYSAPFSGNSQKEADVQLYQTNTGNEDERILFDWTGAKHALTAIYYRDPDSEPRLREWCNQYGFENLILKHIQQKTV